MELYWLLLSQYPFLQRVHRTVAMIGDEERLMRWIAVIPDPPPDIESQLFASAVLLIGAFLGILLLPRLEQRLFDRFKNDDRLPELGSLSEYVPIKIGIRFVTRLGQFALGILASILLLTVWGYEPLLRSVAETLSVTIPLLTRIGGTALLLIGAYFGTMAVGGWVESAPTHARTFNAHDKEILKRVLQIAVLLTAVLIILSLWHVDISGLLFGAGVVGVILGFAAQETLGSIIAGLVMMLSRPFEIGDWIEVGEDRGVVTDITIVHTRIRGPNGEHIIIPNEVIAQQKIRNRSAEKRIRFSVDVGIDYRADVDAAREIAKQTVEEIDMVAESPFPSVLVEELNDSEVTLRIRFWIDRPNAEKLWRVENDVLSEVKAALTKEGINIPYPHQRIITDEKFPEN